MTWEELAAVHGDEQAPNWGDEFWRIDGDPDRDEPPEKATVIGYQKRRN